MYKKKTQKLVCFSVCVVHHITTTTKVLPIGAAFCQVLFATETAGCLALLGLELGTIGDTMS